MTPEQVKAFMDSMDVCAREAMRSIEAFHTIVRELSEAGKGRIPLWPEAAAAQVPVETPRLGFDFVKYSVSVDTPEPLLRRAPRGWRRHVRALKALGRPVPARQFFRRGISPLARAPLRPKGRAPLGPQGIGSQQNGDDAGHVLRPARGMVNRVKSWLVDGDTLRRRARAMSRA